MNNDTINKTPFDTFLEGDGKAVLINSTELPASIYYAEKRFLSKHALDKFSDSGEKYQFEQSGLAPEVDSSALRFGNAFHTLILEPEEFANRYIQMPENIKVRRGKEWDAFCAANVGNRDVLTAVEVEKLKGMRDSILAHDKAKDLLINSLGNPEVTALWKEGNRPCKARIDRVLSEKNIIVDIKTCASAAPTDFMKAVINFRYDVQAAFYLDAVKKATGKDNWRFAIVAVEKEAPYACAVYFLDKWIQLGRETYKRDFAKFIEAEKANKWEGYNVPDDLLPVPRWAETNRGFTDGLPGLESIPY